MTFRGKPIFWDHVPNGTYMVFSVTSKKFPVVVAGNTKPLPKNKTQEALNNLHCEEILK